MPTRISDPALLEEVGNGAGDDELSVIVRLQDPDAIPSGVRIVTRFGDIATVRVERARLLELAESVTALEASKNLRPSFEAEEEADEEADAEQDEEASPEDDPGHEPALYTRRPDGLQGTGRGCIVAVLDWGVDFAHPAFRNADGSTRIISLWDQRGDGPAANRWGYGRLLSRADIDRALKSEHPYQALDYDPADAGQRGGAHGTHVLDIAAGSGEGGGMSGVAPEADLVFVHLARTTEVLGEGNLGDSASVLEALDHVFSFAGERPCVVNMSVGAHGGPHDGTTLVELGIDQAVSLAAGRAVVNSAGNYRTKRAHTTGRVPAVGAKLVRFEVPAHDTNESEVELFYGHIDSLTIEVLGPTGAVLARVKPGEQFPLLDGVRTIGRVYHQIRHGTSGDHHVDVLLQPDAPGGVWALRLIADHVHDGRYHAWIERDRGKQPKFVLDEVVKSSTTGTICNGKLSITCACANPHRLPLTLAAFSSGGPTRDGRIKPELAAPGFKIRAARSTPRGEDPGARYTLKSGTSMAAPHVTGTVALMFEAAGRPLEIYDTRALLFGSVDPSPFFDRPQLGPDLHRIGYGYLDIVAAERAARGFGGELMQVEKPMPHEEAAATVVAMVEQEQEQEQEAEQAEVLQDEMIEVIEVEEFQGEASEVSMDTRELLGSSIGATSWIRDPLDLQRLAHQALGFDDDPKLIRINDPAGMLQFPVGPGDLLVRSAPMSGGRYLAVVLDQPEPWTSLMRRGVPVETIGPGDFVQVVEIPPGGGPPQTIGRRLTTEYGRVPRYQSVLRPVGPGESPESELSETVHIDDVMDEMKGLQCGFLEEFHNTKGKVTKIFAKGEKAVMSDWNGTGTDASVGGHPVPKLIIEPAPDTVTGMRFYDRGLEGERRAVKKAIDKLSDWSTHEPAAGKGHDSWEKEHDRLDGVVKAKERVYNEMWVQQMMFNRFDVPIAKWTRHYNLMFSPGTDLDPNIVKSMAFQESRMGTEGQHLMLPPYDWRSSTTHPIKSRFNILQAIDSFGPQQWLMMKEMAPTLFTRHGLDKLEAKAEWLGMSKREWAAHPTFPTALREFFEARSGGANLMGTPGKDLHEDYEFWIRTGIRWLYEKHNRMKHPTWPGAVKRYNGAGEHADRYQQEVMARVGGTQPVRATEEIVEEEAAELTEDVGSLSDAAELSWINLTKTPDSKGVDQLFYVITGAPAGKAKVGNEGKAIFPLRIHNNNWKYNFKDPRLKWRLLDIADKNRHFKVAKEWETLRKGVDIEDESTRIVPVTVLPESLAAAYNEDYPLTRIEVEYHWREHFFTHGEWYYNRAGLDFMLVAPIEFLVSQRKLVGKEVALDDYDKYGQTLWIPLPYSPHFTPEMHQPISVSLELSTTLKQDTLAERLTSSKTTKTKTTTHAKESGWNAQLSLERSQGVNVKGNIELLEVGLSEMMKIGGSFGYSSKTIDTSQQAVAHEFSEALRISRSYGSSITGTVRMTAQVSPPQVPIPRGTGNRPTPEPVSGYGRVGLYLYPVLQYYEVPFVKFEGVNEYGQATKRTAGTVLVPWINSWTLITRVP
jgi:subtilisin family serine protease